MKIAVSLTTNLRIILRPGGHAAKLLLIAEQVGNLHEQRSAIVQITSVQAQKILIGIDRIDPERAIKILQIAVVSHVNCRAGMGQVGQQKIEIKLLRGLQRGQ
jgi:hypothetical protein